MEEKLRALQEKLYNSNIKEFLVYAFNKDELTILGSFDIVYYQEVLIKFYSVKYIDCAIDFEYPLFRMASEEEINTLAEKIRYGVDWIANKVVCICEYNNYYTDYSDMIPDKKCFIVAKEISIEFGNFSYKILPDNKDGGF